MTTTISPTNVTEGYYNGTMLTDGSTKLNNAYEDYGLHPGITTIISFAVAIVLVLVYLYYENVIGCVKKACFRKQSTKNGETGGTDEDIEMHANGGHASSAGSSKKLVEEPGILCECGQIHLLKDCLKENELSPYKDIFDRIRNLAPESEQTIENERNTPAKTKQNLKMSPKREQYRQRSPERPATPVIVICDEKGEMSSNSSPKSATPLINVKPANTVTTTSVIHAKTGARPKKYKIENGVS